MATKDKYKPKWKVSGLSVSRKGLTWTAKWKILPDALKNDKVNCFTSIEARWTLDRTGAKDIVEKDSTGIERTTSFSESLKEFKKGLKRASFYPKTAVKLLGVKVMVRGVHTHSGKKHYGDWTKPASYDFGVPEKPVIEIDYTAGTQVVSWNIKTDPGDGKKERHDTYYRVYAERDGMPNWTILNWTSSTATEISGSADLDDAGITWSDEKAVTVHVEAIARGFAGDSNPATKELRVVWPSKPTIDGVKAANTGRVKVTVKIIQDNVDTVQLQRQLDVQPGVEPSASAWQDVSGALDNGNCSALYDLVGDAKSTDGLYTWYRVKVTRSGFTDYSDAERADDLFTQAATAENDHVGIVNAKSGKNGTTAVVVIGYSDDTPNTGTEVAWSDNPDAIISTEQPKTFPFKWHDDESQSQDWDNTAAVIVDGLSEGVRYYIWARRYLEADGVTTYTEWSDPWAVDPALQPTSVTLNAPGSVARGEDIQLSWTFDGDAVQTGYSVHPTDDSLKAYAEGDDAMGVATIPAERYGDATSIEVLVTVETSGDPIDSNVRTITIADPPTLELCAPEAVAVQGDAFEAYTDKPTSTLMCSCEVGENIVLSLPDGERRQFAGDVLWASEAKPSWTLGTWDGTALRERLQSELADAEAYQQDMEDELEELEPGDEGYEDAVVNARVAAQSAEAAQAALDAHPADGAVYVAQVGLPLNLDLIDGKEYVVRATATDASTGLSSGEAESSFEVEWAHQAPEPPDGMEVVVDQAARTATIALMAPQGAEAGDRYDLYRGASGGFQLVRSGLAMDETVTDKYPTFGDGSYIVCTRTEDGDLSWAEYAYSLPMESSRFDWPGGFLELSFSLAYNDSAEKRFEAREHLDGGTGGYYNPGVTKKGSYAAKAIEGVDDLASLDALASHDGSVYCRTPDGKAFECNCNLSVEAAQRSPLKGLSFSLTRVDITQQYMVDGSDIEAGA